VELIIGIRLIGSARIMFGKVKGVLKMDRSGLVAALK
jgi:hypothetical protein